VENEGDWWGNEGIKKILEAGFNIIKRLDNKFKLKIMRFLQLGLNEIVGRALKANKASIHVLEKIGVTFRRELDFDGKEGVWYSITKQEYFSKF